MCTPCPWDRKRAEPAKFCIEAERSVLSAPTVSLKNLAISYLNNELKSEAIQTNTVNVNACTKLYIKF